MAKNSPLKDLVIRAAAVRLADTGYIVAGDINAERDDLAHAIVFRWKAGVFNSGKRNYNAHSLCVIEVPDLGYVDISGQGYYSITTPGGISLGDIFDDSSPAPKKRRTASFRSVASILGKAYAVGLRGLVYRLDGLRKWTRIDEGLPDSFNIQAIHGYGEMDLYAVGRHGALWQFDGKAWIERDMPTSANLTSVKCAGDGKVYVAGHGGVLIRGRADVWEVIDHQSTDDDIWDIEWFDQHVYLSTMHTVYCLKDDRLESVDFGDDPPGTCYQLSTAPGVMWSSGEFDIVSFDGRRWSRVV